MTDKEQYHQYLLSPEWKEFRKKVFEHYGRKCAHCKRTKRLHIHHKTYANIFNEKLEDVMVLCEIHHAKIHGIKVEKVAKKQKKSHIKKDVKFVRKRSKKKKKGNRMTFKKDKGQHRIKTEFPALDAILERKRIREQNKSTYMKMISL